MYEVCWMCYPRSSAAVHYHHIWPGGICMKAYPNIWNHPERYSTHIILMGSFHLACAVIRMLGKVDRSGFSDILPGASLTGSGSIQGILSDKYYDRAVYCHKVLAEALEHLLLRHYFSSHDEELSKESWGFYLMMSREKLLRLSNHQWKMQKFGTIGTTSWLTMHHAKQGSWAWLLNCGSLLWIMFKLCWLSSML